MESSLAKEIFTSCSEANAGSAEGLLICMTDRLIQEHAEDHGAISRSQEYSRNVSVLFCSALAFFMQAGFAMVCAGAVRKKNLQNTMLKNLLDACAASIAFYSVGYAFAFGDGPNPNGFVGTSNFFLNGVDDVGFWLFQYAFSAASATIVAGTLAERCQMSAYFYYTIFLSGWVYPIAVHAVWSQYGFLSATHESPLFGVGVIDIAGGGVVHVTGGCTALIATWVLGPRRGRFHDEKTGEILENPKPIKGHNISLSLLGTILLWFGWYGFNAGSALLVGGLEYGDILASLAATNTTLSGGSAGISALFFDFIVTQYFEGTGRYDLMHAMNGVLAGLVAITAGCGVVEPWAAVIIGILAGILYLLSSWGLIWFRLDDAVDAIPVHMVNGIWGMLATGLFASPDHLEQAFGSSVHFGCFYSGSGIALLGAQVIGTLFIVGWTTGIMLPFFLFLEQQGFFRASAMQEVIGLDKAYFNTAADEHFDDITAEQISQLAKDLETQLRLPRHHKSGLPSNSKSLDSADEDYDLHLSEFPKV